MSGGVSSGKKRLLSFERDAAVTHAKRDSKAVIEPDSETLAYSKQESNRHASAEYHIESRSAQEVFEEIKNLKHAHKVVVDAIKTARQDASKLMDCARKMILKEQCPQLPDLTSDGMLTLLSLRRSHRELHHLIETQKDRVSSHLRQELDSLVRRLQTAQYLHQHYQREIAACRQFKPLESEPDLIEEHVWSAEAEGALASTSSDSEHLRILKRLDYELKLRESMKEDIENTYPKRHIAYQKLMREKALNEVTLRAQKIEKVHKFVFELSRSENPQETISDSVSLLPQPLYNAFFFFNLWCSLLPETHPSIKIVGDRDVAFKFNSNNQLGLEELKKLDSDHLHATHPLHLSWKLSFANLRSITVYVHYYIYLNILTCKIAPESESNMLALLFPNDSGMDTPNFVNNFITPTSQPFVLKNVQGYAYQWLQSLAGLQFFQPPSKNDSPDEPSQRTIQHGYSSLMTQIHQRFQIREKLAEQIKLLQSNQIPATVPGFVPKSTFKKTKLIGWRRLDADSLKKIINVMGTRIENQTNLFNGMDSSLELPEANNNCTPTSSFSVRSETSCFYLAHFSLAPKSAAALVEIPGDYPVSKSIFTLFSEKNFDSNFNSALEEAQKNVNSLQQSDDSQYLIFQIKILQDSLNRFAESEFILKQKPKSDQ